MMSTRLKKHALFSLMIISFIAGLLYALRDPSVTRADTELDNLPAQVYLNSKSNWTLRGVTIDLKRQRHFLQTINIAESDTGLVNKSIGNINNISAIIPTRTESKKGTSSNRVFKRKTYNQSYDKMTHQTNTNSVSLLLPSNSTTLRTTNNTGAKIPPAATKCGEEKVGVFFQENRMMAEVNESEKSLLLSRLNDRRTEHDSTLSLGIHVPDWFSLEDVNLMQMMSSASIDDVYTIQYHLQLKVLVFDSCWNNSQPQGKVPIQQCPRCGLRKQPADNDEIFAFHLDRVLGINRAPPAVARIFKDFPEGPEKEEDAQVDRQSLASESVYPVMWWDPEVVHDPGDGAFMQDQNSLSISWLRYQRILWNFCWIGNSIPKPEEDCPIYHQDWVRMAIFDFLLQNHDRLDRECCGFNRDIGDNLKCFTTEGQHCINTPDERWLVHIFTRSRDPHRLIFIDNKLNALRNGSDLNYQLMQGIISIPSAIAQKLRSEHLKDRLFESLRYDRTYWKDVLAGEKGAEKLWNVIEERIRALLDYMKIHDFKEVD